MKEVISIIADLMVAGYVGYSVYAISRIRGAVEDLGERMDANFDDIYATLTTIRDEFTAACAEDDLSPYEVCGACDAQFQSAVFTPVDVDLSELEAERAHITDEEQATINVARNVLAYAYQKRGVA